MFMEHITRVARKVKSFQRVGISYPEKCNNYQSYDMHGLLCSINRETLQMIYNCHSELVKSLASNPMRYSPVFHLEDFFGRYSDMGQFFDGAHVSFADMLLDPTQDTYTGHDLYAPRTSNASLQPAASMIQLPQPRNANLPLPAAKSAISK